MHIALERRMFSGNEASCVELIAEIILFRGTVTAQQGNAYGAYPLVVFDFIVQDVGRRLLHLWPGEGDTVWRGPVFPDDTHQSRTWGFSESKSASMWVTPDNEPDKPVTPLQRAPEGTRECLKCFQSSQKKKTVLALKGNISELKVQKVHDAYIYKISTL